MRNSHTQEWLCFQNAKTDQHHPRSRGVRQGACGAPCRGGSPLDERTLEALAGETHIELRPAKPEQEAAGAKNCVFLDGADVTQEIRTSEVAQAASRLATIAKVRQVLVAEQQRAGAGGGIVMEGR